MHFFIDHNSLPIQNSIDTFGVDGNNPMNKFNITSQFLLTAEQAKIFACQNALMIVQQSMVDNSLVNIILKPTGGINVPYKSVRYYIYRGVRKDSFINGNAIVSQAESNTEFIANIWKTWEDYKTTNNQSELAEPTPLCFGYDSTIVESLHLENMYDNSQNAVPIFVKEGEWIGNVGNEFPIGFEIIVEANTPDINLGYLRAEKISIDVTGLSGLELKAKREQVLSFIYPAAFFGIHYDTGVKISTYNGNEKTTETKKRNEIYSLLLSKFATKNTIYLDIRSEHGYSYNFYENYGDNLGNNIKIGNALVDPIEQNYSTNGWPILIITDSSASVNNENNIKINLRIDDNIKPILFFENTKLISDDNVSRFIEDNKILNGTDEWSKDLTFVFPNTDNNTEKENVAYYIQLNYFRQKYNPASPNTVLKNDNYFNSAFCPIDLPNLANPNWTFQQVYNPNGNYLNGTLPNTEKYFGYIANSGAFWDDNRMLFYSQAVFAHQNSGEFYPKNNNGNENKFSLNSKWFDLSLKKDISIYCRTFQEETINNQYTPFKSISISHYNDFSNAKENLLLLGIKINELQALIDTANEIDPITQLPKLSTKHHCYLFLEEDLPSPKTDKEGNLFRKFNLKVQGIDSNGESAIITPNNDIFLYTKDGLCFTSKEFAESETDNDVSKLIDFIPLDKNDISKSVKRLSMQSNEIAWQLYDLDSVPKKYDTGEVNYAGSSIAGKKIELPVGTRSIILGESKDKLKNYIVCFHEGTYREGFVDKNAFTNSNKDENGTLSRVNKLEGNAHPEVIWKSFLDDAKRIIDYCERINSFTGVFPPFRSLITDTKNNFKTLLNTFTPYSNPSNLIIKLQQLNEIIQSEANISLELGNLGCNLENTVDSINRWLAFSPLKQLIIDFVCGDINTETTGFKSIVISIRIGWFKTWKSYLVSICPQNTQLAIENAIDMIVTNVEFTGDVASNIPSIEDPPFASIKMILKTLNIELNNINLANQPVMATPEAQWIKSLNYTDITNASNFIVIGEANWIANSEKGYNRSNILVDHSIGYINSIAELSCLIHEISSLHYVQSENKKYNPALYFDTHGFDTNREGDCFREYQKILDILVDTNTTLNYFQTFSKDAHDGPWTVLFTTPHANILYLKYYLDKLLE